MNLTTPDDACFTCLCQYIQTHHSRSLSVCLHCRPIIWIQTFVCALALTHSCTFTHTSRMHTQTHKLSFSLTCTLSYTHPHMHAFTQDTHTHTDTHKLSLTHTHSLPHIHAQTYRELCITHFYSYFIRNLPGVSGECYSARVSAFI